MSYFTTGAPGKERGTNKLPTTEEFQKSQKERGHASPYVLPTPRIFLAGIHLGWAMCTPPGRTLSQTMGQARWLARDSPETNPTTIKPETASHVAEQFSWVPLPCCPPPRRPFPIKSLALSARVSPWTVHFRVLGKSPLSGRPWKESPFLQHLNPSFPDFPKRILTFETFAVRSEGKPDCGMFNESISSPNGGLRTLAIRRSGFKLWLAKSMSLGKAFHVFES